MGEQMTKSDIEKIKALKIRAEELRASYLLIEKGYAERGQMLKFYMDAREDLVDILEEHCDQLCELALEGLARKGELLHTTT